MVILWEGLSCGDVGGGLSCGDVGGGVVLW